MPPGALRSLLPDGRLPVSTKLHVTSGLSAATAARGDLIVALWCWLAAALGLSLIALANGADLGATASALALLAAPAFAGFVLAQRLGAPAAALALIASWLAMGVGLTASAGGAFTPLAASLAIAPALTALVRREWVVWAAATAVLAYPLAAALGMWGGPAQGLGPLQELTAAAALTFAGGLIGCALHARDQVPPPAAHDDAAARRIAEVSHELRTPLNHIIGFSDAIASEVFGPAGPRNLEYAKLIGVSGRQLLDLVNDLLDLSRIDSGRLDLHRESFDVAALIQQAMTLAQASAAHKQIALGADMAAPLMVNADERALRRAVTNLIGNALKFTPEGGAVRTSARIEGETLVIDVTDTGPGIPETERARLGAPFERGASAMGVEGAGLGLSFVRAIAHAHGGRLSFHDAEGGGALVRLTLPVLKA